MSRRQLFIAALFQSLCLAGPVWATVMDVRDLPPSATSFTSLADRTYAEGLRAFAKGDLAAAEKAFQQALAQQSNHASALLGLAEVAFQKKQLNQAAKYIEKAVKVAPENAHAQASWGRYLALNKRYSDAETALKRANDLDGTLVRSRMDLADLYTTAMQQPAQAVILYQEVLAIQPDHAGANYALGVALAKQGELIKARAPLEKSAQLAPNNPLPLVALAQVAASQKALDEAVRFINQALKIQPGLVGALELRGDLNDMRGHAQQALADYAAAAKAAPGLATVQFKLGFVRQRLNKTKEAMQAYKDAIRAAPDMDPAYNNLAWLSVQSGLDLSQAEVWARKAVTLAPKSAPYLDTLGWVLYAKHQYLDSVNTLQASLKLSRQADTLYHLGMAQQASGNTAGAESAFRDALNLEPSHAGAKKALAELKR